MMGKKGLEVKTSNTPNRDDCPKAMVTVPPYSAEILFGCIRTPESGVPESQMVDPHARLGFELTQPAVIMLKRKQNSQKAGKKRKFEAKNEKILKKEKLEQQSRVKTEEEQRQVRLEKIVFGGASDVLDNIDHFENVRELAQMRIGSAETEDSGVEGGDSDPESNTNMPSDNTPEYSGLQPAWQDDDDAGISVKEAFALQERKQHEKSAENYIKSRKNRFESMMGTPKWATLNRKEQNSDSEDDSGDEFLQHCGNFLSKKTTVLHKGVIELKRLRDLNMETYTEGPLIKSIQFHPGSTVGLVAGVSGVASLFQVDGYNNTKLQSVQFERFPIHCARFTNDGCQFLVGSQHHRHFFCYDMMADKSLRIINSPAAEITHMKNFEMSPDGRVMVVCGRYGNIHILTARTREHIGTLKMNGEVTSVTFNADGSRMYSHGDSGEVYIWDMSARACVHRFLDDGCIVGSSLAFSPNSQFLACGSLSGIVNVYDARNLTTSNAPSPLKILLNLTTPVTSLKFNAASEILAMASNDKDNAIKLVHFPSMTVFNNFPSAQTPLFRPQCLDFSLNSGYFTLGNGKGAALLFSDYYSLYVAQDDPLASCSATTVVCRWHRTIHLALVQRLL
uniref:U3 small nucleolar RNA-associated protein 18 homolog n=1 Tax=Timema monikensis TaxID=170555 RepID=A0A7R9EFD4_9NEOP|nr:unnamed protein product [Timema monikensis]